MSIQNVSSVKLLSQESTQSSVPVVFTTLRLHCAPFASSLSLSLSDLILMLKKNFADGFGFSVAARLCDRLLPECLKCLFVIVVINITKREGRTDQLGVR